MNSAEIILSFFFGLLGNTLTTLAGDADGDKRKYIEEAKSRLADDNFIPTSIIKSLKELTISSEDANYLKVLVSDDLLIGRIQLLITGNLPGNVLTDKLIAEIRAAGNLKAELLSTVEPLVRAFAESLYRKILSNPLYSQYLIMQAISDDGEKTRNYLVAHIERALPSLTANKSVAIFDKYIERIGTQNYLKKAINNEPFVTPCLEKKATEDDDLMTNDSFITIDNNTLLEDNKDYVIVSNSGTGKTTFLRWLEQCTNEKQTHRLPIYIHCVELQDFVSHSELINLISSRCIGIDDYDVIKSFMEGIFNQSRFLFLVDGFDQVMHYSKLPSLFRSKSLFGSNKVILSTRPYAYFQNHHELDEYTYLRIKQFDIHQIKFYLGEYSKVLEQHLILNRLGDVLGIPMLLTLVKKLIKSGRTENIRTRSDLYREYINELFDREKQFDKKRLQSYEYPPVAIIARNLELISFKAFEAGFLHGISKSFCYETLNDDYQLMNKIINWGILNEFIDIDSKEEKILFHHQSLQEYFAATYLAKNFNMDNVLVSFFKVPAWEEVLKYYFGIFSDCSRFIEKSLRILQRADKVALYEASLTFAIISETCLAVPLASNKSHLYSFLKFFIDCYIDYVSDMKKRIDIKSMQLEGFLLEYAEIIVRELTSIETSMRGIDVSVKVDFNKQSLDYQSLHDVMLTISNSVRNQLVAVGGFLSRLNKQSIIDYNDELGILFELEHGLRSILQNTRGRTKG